MRTMRPLISDLISVAVSGLTKPLTMMFSSIVRCSARAVETGGRFAVEPFPPSTFSQPVPAKGSAASRLSAAAGKMILLMFIA